MYSFFFLLLTVQRSRVKVQGLLQWRFGIQNIPTSYLTCADHKQAYKSWPELSQQLKMWVYLCLTVQCTQSLRLSVRLYQGLFLVQNDWQHGESWDSFNQEVICIGEMMPELWNALASGCPGGILALWCPTRFLFALVGGKNKTRAGWPAVWSNNTKMLLVFKFQGHFSAVIYRPVPLKSQDPDHAGCQKFQLKLQNKEVLH